MRNRQVMALALDRITKAASAATHFRSEGGLLMRCVSFLLVILAVAGTSSVRGSSLRAREALRQERRDDRQEGREERRDDRQERAAIGEATTSCYALRFLRRFATGILEIGSRSERNVATMTGREERRDDRQEARGDRGGDHELLRLALLAALRDGDFGDRQSVREERREGRAGTSG